MILEHTRKTNPETNMQVYAIDNSQYRSPGYVGPNFGAVLKDLDSGSIVPHITFYPTEAEAVAQCEKILGI